MEWEPSIEILRLPLFDEYLRHVMLSGRNQVRASRCYQIEEIEWNGMMEIMVVFYEIIFMIPL